jgi:D-serine deaminase-like pyridoxal phosphate-dependent protein
MDIDILERNIEKMQSAVERAGKRLRPHAKTHKCSELAKKQIEAGAIGVCTAKLSEAEVLVNKGIENVLITGPIVTRGKIEGLADLASKVSGLTAVVDNPGVVDSLDAALRTRRVSINVLLDIDVGLHRTGVKTSDAPALAEKIVSCRSLTLRGIQAYAGHVQHIKSYEDRKQVSHKCLQEAIRIFHKLKTSFPTCTIFSASGTGTSEIDLAVPEITELQVGSYVCMDTEYLEIESGEHEKGFKTFDPALRLLTTVISTNQEGFVTVDAGLKSLYKDGGIPKVIFPKNSGFEYDWFGDEYGKITCTDNLKLPAVGDVLELVVSHCDPTVNLFDEFFLVREGKVTGVWKIDLRGRSQ